MFLPGASASGAENSVLGGVRAGALCCAVTVAAPMVRATTHETILPMRLSVVTWSSVSMVIRSPERTVQFALRVAFRLLARHSRARAVFAARGEERHASRIIRARVDARLGLGAARRRLCRGANGPEAARGCGRDRQ